jgi:hypothetical protein
MIGPHEGRELELMLAGKKNLAVFHALLNSGDENNQQIIPEDAFAPYVSNGMIVRLSEDVQYSNSSDIIRYVCFTLPAEEWRARFFLWLNREYAQGRIQWNDSYNSLIGGLLGYTSNDIDDFLKNRSALHKTLRA